MKIKHLLTVIVCTMVVVSTVQAQGFMGKLKQKAEQAAERAVDKKIDQKTGGSRDSNDETIDPGNEDNSGYQERGSTRTRPSNKGGGGLISTPPDVKGNLSEAETAYKAKSYGEARYALQQAMLGVEMEIGKKILASLPAAVNGISKDDASDQVTSTGWGWAGLTIQRIYFNDDQEIKTTIANNAAWMSAVNMYLSSGGYAQSTGGEQNWKQTKVKGYRAVIEYDESSGYKLSVPLGQSSLIVWEVVNFASEQEVMKAAEGFDIDGIKKMLGEQ